MALDLNKRPIEPVPKNPFAGLNPDIFNLDPMPTPTPSTAQAPPFPIRGKPEDWRLGDDGVWNHIDSGARYRADGTQIHPGEEIDPAQTPFPNFPDFPEFRDYGPPEDKPRRDDDDKAAEWEEYQERPGGRDPVPFPFPDFPDVPDRPRTPIPSDGFRPITGAPPPPAWLMSPDAGGGGQGPATTTPIDQPGYTTPDYGGPMPPSTAPPTGGISGPQRDFSPFGEPLGKFSAPRAYGGLPRSTGPWGLPGGWYDGQAAQAAALRG